MKTKLLALFIVGTMVQQLSAQVLYSESFGGLTLTDSASGMPSGMVELKGIADTMATNTNVNNAPFNATPYSTSAWAAYVIGNDTAAISSSWTNPTSTVDRWLITPPISGIDTSTVLTWEGLASDASFPDGYEVWVSVAAGAHANPAITDFTANSNNKLFTLTAESATAFAMHSLSLKGFAGNTVRIAFRNNSNNKFHLFIDDINVFNALAKDGAVAGILMNKYVLAGNQIIKAVFKSFGWKTVITDSLSYSIDGGFVTSQAFASNISYGQSYTSSFSFVPFISAGLHTIKVWVKNANVAVAGVDANPLNDTAMFQITSVSVSAKPAKKVLIEEFTDAGCGFCLPADAKLNSLIAADTSIIGVAIHELDSMSTTEGSAVAGNYMPYEHSGMIDRTMYATTDNYFFDYSQWVDTAATRKNELVPATVSLSAIAWNALSRQISVTVTATFIGAVKGEYALNCYVAENNVYGPLNDNSNNNWNQQSYYYSDPTSSFYLSGFIPPVGDQSIAYLRPSEYKHNRVVDKILGGAYGDNTVIPLTAINAGQSFSKTFTYTLPISATAYRFNPDNIYLIGTVQEYSTTSNKDRTILNVAQHKLTANAETVGPVSVQSIEKAAFGTVAIFPNPASISASIVIDLNKRSSVLVSVYNAIGQVVFSENRIDLMEGEHVLNLDATDFANGIYNVVITTGTNSLTKKIVVNK